MREANHLCLRKPEAIGGKKLSSVRIEALEMPEISGDLLPPPDDRTANIAQEEGLELAGTLEWSCLLGNHYWDITTGSVKRLTEKLEAVETAFGWVLQGTDTTSSAAACLTSVGVMRISVNTEPDDVSRQLRSFWELEHLGIVDDAPLTNENNDVLREFEDTIVHKNGRYEVRLPWKENASQLADNKRTASHRLHSLTAKLLRNDEMIRSYDQAVRNYLDAGHAEEANELGESPQGPFITCRTEALSGQHILLVARSLPILPFVGPAVRLVAQHLPEATLRREHRRSAEAATEFLWVTVLLRDSGVVPVVFQGGAVVPSSVQQLLATVHKIADKAPIDQREQCLSEGVDVLLRAPVSTPQALSVLRKTASFFRTSELALMQSDKEGGFVGLPKRLFKEKAASAMEKSLFKA
ncbi:hypothetical protein HPB52_007156 [Rhipicephalus sanguineus]|uniref:Uncharacterized protein n=1 Tax=Rhipicephalus sanguineus TaxID=34632 RepID=A0A9D4T7V0_RHISA|nr:hypothetical protein HPB52_007156 [Rhipicephalus sanguineus]